MCALSISIPHTGLFELAGFEAACAKLGSSNSRIRKEHAAINESNFLSLGKVVIVENGKIQRRAFKVIHRLQVDFQYSRKTLASH